MASTLLGPEALEGEAVIPLLLHRPPTINIRWWVQLIGHIPFVGAPIAFVSRPEKGRNEN